MGEYETAVHQFIVDNFLFGVADPSLGEDDSFLETGVVDSTGVLELVAWVEDTFGISVRDVELLPENFDSVRRLAAYVARRVPA